jgi:hypothetical protein
MDEKRRSPRQEFLSKQKIVRLDAGQTPVDSVVMTKDFSSSGLKVITSEKLVTSNEILVCLNDQLKEMLKTNDARLIRSGKMYLSKIVWSKQHQDGYEHGIDFITKEKSSPELLETFTELVNASILSQFN